MNLSEIHSLKSKFVVRAVGNELILVPLTGNIASMSELFTLNETGKFIWENIDEKNSIEDIAKLMTECFDVEATIATHDVETFVSKLTSMISR